MSCLRSSGFRLSSFCCLLVVVVMTAAAALFSPASPAAAENGALPAPLSRLFFRVYRLIDQQEFSQAADVLEKFCRQPQNRKYAKHPDLLFIRGNCCLALEDYDCAAHNYGRAIALRPDHAPSRRNLANALYNQQKYDEAADNFAAAFALQEKKEPELLYYCGICWLLAGENSRAVRTFAGLIADFPRQVSLKWQEGLARALIADGQNRRALPLLEKLVAENKGREKKEWSRILLHQYLQLAMHHRAEQLALELARHYPQEDCWWQAATHAALEQDRLEEAVMALTIISFLRPLAADETRLLAQLNLRAGIPARALEAYEKLLAAAPSPLLLKYAVYACRRLDKREKALELLKKHEQLTRQNFDLLLLRADLFYSLSRLREARKTYIQAARFGKTGKEETITQSREKGRAWLMAGYCAWQLHDLGKALEAFNMAARFPGQRQKALEAGGRVKKALKLS